MNLQDAKAIIETISYTEVNLYLQAGWVLIGNASMTTDSRESSEPMIKYSLAWTKEGKPVHPDRFSSAI